MISRVTGRKRVAVMFSGGLDSTYAAWKLKNDGHSVELYHVRMLFENRDNEPETVAARRVAEVLGLPFHLLAEVWVPTDHAGRVMRVPVIAAAVLCHSELQFDVLATGMAPSISPRDKGWDLSLRCMADSCMPGVEIAHPRDGVLRSNIWLPTNLRELVYSGPGHKGDDQ